MKTGDGGRRAGQAEGAGHRRRHAAPPLNAATRRPSSASATARSARSSTRSATGTAAQIWVDRPRAGVERHGMAAPQLELLHLALRRSHRRAARAQPGRHELGARRASGPRRLGLGGRQVRTGDAPRPHLRPLRRRVRVSRRRRMFSQCRQINGCDEHGRRAVVGTEGTSNCANRIEPKSGEKPGGSAQDAAAPTARSTRT